MTKDQQPSQGLQEVVDFLLGEKPLDGKWFGEKYENLPAYWWRENLRAALQQPSQGDVERGLLASLRAFVSEHARGIQHEMGDAAILIDLAADRIAALHSTSEGRVEQMAQIIDPDAFHDKLPTDGCGSHWMSRRAKAKDKARAIAALGGSNE